jgi:hypothetical protein
MGRHNQESARSKVAVQRLPSKSKTGKKDDKTEKIQRLNNGIAGRSSFKKY